jgi:hypothetical protein
MSQLHPLTLILIVYLSVNECSLANPVIRSTLFKVTQLYRKSTSAAEVSFEGMGEGLLEVKSEQLNHFQLQRRKGTWNGHCQIVMTKHYSLVFYTIIRN